MSARLLISSPVRIPADSTYVDAELNVPADARGLVIFAHGSGSGRLSPRNTVVARRLNANGLATLLADLLTPEEDLDYKVRFDIDMLAERLTALTDWAYRDSRVRELPIGYFGSSTGAAAALLAASGAQDVVRAVVCRGGRVDLAGNAAERLTVPTLLVVGQRDRDIIEINQEAFARLRGKKELAVIPAASHLFEEPGALDRVAVLAAGWFNEYLTAAPVDSLPDQTGP